MAAKDGSGPRPAAQSAKRCFLNCLFSNCLKKVASLTRSPATAGFGGSHTYIYISLSLSLLSLLSLSLWNQCIHIFSQVNTTQTLDRHICICLQNIVNVPQLAKVKGLLAYRDDFLDGHREGPPFPDFLTCRVCSPFFHLPNSKTVIVFPSFWHSPLVLHFPGLWCLGAVGRRSFWKGVQGEAQEDRGLQVGKQQIHCISPFGSAFSLKAWRLRRCNPFLLILNVPLILKTGIHLQFPKISVWPIWLLIDPL